MLKSKFNSMRKLILMVICFLILAFTPVKTQTKIDKVIAHAVWQTTQKVTYNGSYFKISYPNGDVPANIGVCTDVIIRAYRSIGVDLQQLIHEDMLANKDVYDKRRFSKIVDSNIDHRRVPNLQTFFTRQGSKLPISQKGSDYKPGDIVFWDIAAGHVGIVIDEKVPGTDRYYIVHNICCGPQKEDFLFSAKIVDHYRWIP
jgi:uncharacterized protein YijF (DUF1287 family)